MGTLDPNLLRQIVSDAVREAIAERQSSNLELVSIATDVDLQRLVGRVVALMENPITAARLSSGQIRFALDRDRDDGSVIPSGLTAPHHTPPLSGVIGEKTINSATRGKELVLAPNAVVTPIARDRARERGISLVRRPTC
ncbi:hypothetical protein FHS55_004400 [Angulomicrobium tetraedrale]|uniref:Uncharacterized protein n=1 Tax=Ancylobacter tetraedralis TaxID=217068 RepID=A0A839ZGK8_9HYPH|nr:hypothetical protein [Ancylobacter tetraedralis]MBB3773756.1 hypothetical protein [Ancylobacter tetraedralis]